MSFNQGIPGPATLINSSSTLLYGNTSSGNALSVQQLGAGNVFRFSNAAGLANVMVMNNLGQVGIGQTSPASGLILDVRATAGLIGDEKLGSTSGNQSNVIVQVGNGSSSTFGALKIIGNRTANGSDFTTTSLRIQKYVDVTQMGYMEFGALGGNQDIAFGSGGTTERMRITNAGYVGIGTTNPGATLDVMGSSTISTPTYVFLRNGGGGQNSTGSDLVATQIAIGNPSYGPWIRAVQGNGYYTDGFRLDFCTNITNNDTTPVPRLTILGQSGAAGSARIGIGTTNPTDTLNVVGSANVCSASGLFITTTTSGATSQVYAQVGFPNNGSAVNRDVLTLQQNNGGKSRINIWGDVFNVGPQIDYGSTYHRFMKNDMTTFIGGFFSALTGGATTISVDGNGFIIRGATSDRRLKSNIESMTQYGLATVSNLNPVSFEWNDDAKVNFGDGLQYGLIAQDVQQVFPWAVSESHDEQKTLTIDYPKFTPVLINAIKELSAENTALKQSLVTATARLDSLEQRLAAAGL